ncbi:hypothetical protein HK097_006828, partial [Rhizophlyctis rosea]
MKVETATPSDQRPLFRNPASEAGSESEGGRAPTPSRSLQQQDERPNMQRAMQWVRRDLVDGSGRQLTPASSHRHHHHQGGQESGSETSESEGSGSGSRTSSESEEGEGGEGQRHAGRQRERRESGTTSSSGSGTDSESDEGNVGRGTPSSHVRSHHHQNHHRTPTMQQQQQQPQYEGYLTEMRRVLQNNQARPTSPNHPSQTPSKKSPPKNSHITTSSSAAASTLPPSQQDLLARAIERNQWLEERNAELERKCREFGDILRAQNEVVMGLRGEVRGYEE